MPCHANTKNGECYAYNSSIYTMRAQGVRRCELHAAREIHFYTQWRWRSSGYGGHCL